MTRSSLATLGAAAALAAGLAVASPAAAAPAPGPAAIQATDSFKLCPWPGNCTAASITGQVDWSTNSVDAVITNNSYTSISGSIDKLTFVGMPRGRRVGSLRIPATQASVRVTLCVPPTLMPFPCTSVEVVRPAG